MSKATETVVIHGHRGSRGTHPENLIPSFREARDAGARFIELDVHLSKDGVPIVFHDPEISGKLCRDSAGQPLQKSVAISELTAGEIQAFECGSLTLPNFPEQKPTPGARVPTLENVLNWKLQEAPNLGLNIEIKREAAGSNPLPPADRLAERVVALLWRYRLIEGTLVQSFDFEVVRAARRFEPKLRLSCLFENDADFAREAKANGAQVAAPYYKLLTAKNVARCIDQGIEVLPWTVNERQDWESLLKMGVRSIITDYPRKLRDFLLGYSM